jgi:hypothetical protein
MKNTSDDPNDDDWYAGLNERTQLEVVGLMHHTAPNETIQDFSIALYSC